MGIAPADWEASSRRHKVMSLAMKQWGTRGADMVYAMQNESADFLRYAKTKNIKIVNCDLTDMTIDRVLVMDMVKAYKKTK